MDAQTRYDDARNALHDGRHAEALEGFIWFHRHALQESESWRGVRLSYALSAWMDLARVYPPALLALRAERDEAAESLLRGDADKGAFRDVVVIDEKLDQAGQTYQLYLALEQRQPALAQACGRFALDAMIAAGDLVRAADVAPDFERTI